MLDILKKESKFEKYAEVAANRYLNDKVSLNDSIVKIAEEKDLNPDQIKRVVEAANVKVFQKHFSDEDREGSKDVDFDVADPKTIIKRIFVIKKGPIMSDDSHTASPLDFFKDLASDSFHDRTDSEVSDLVPEEKKHNAPTLVIRIKSAKANLEKQAYIKSEEYVEKVAEFSKQFRRSDRDKSAFGEFCKEAFEHKGQEIIPVLESIAKESKEILPNFEAMPFTKVAGLPSKNIETLETILKIASEYKRYETAVTLAEEQLSDMRN